MNCDAVPWYAAWPPRPPRDNEACPICGYGLDDGTETKHECPPGFLASEAERIEAHGIDSVR